jgi:hypothetical protein
MARSHVYGYLAEFANPAALYAACERVRDAGYREWDAHSPFPIHGIESAMGMSWSKVPWFSLVCGLSGAAVGFLGQTWVATSAYKLIISGKPLFSWQAFIPVTFEVGILCTALGTLLGMFLLNGLPRLSHPIFNSTAFERATDDAFFISIEARDAKFDAEKTKAFLQDIGATYIELVEEGK